MFGLGLLELIIIVVILLSFLFVLALIVLLIKTILGTKKISSLSQSERLNELQKMKDNHLITSDEFDKKRGEIINSL